MKITNINALTASQVITHAKKQAKRGKGPSLPYKGIKNPRLALHVAELEEKGQKPEIFMFSYEHLRSLVERHDVESEGREFSRLFYKGKEFTCRGCGSANDYRWEDKKIVFVGTPDENEITYKDEDAYWLNERLNPGAMEEPEFEEYED